MRLPLATQGAAVSGESTFEALGSFSSMRRSYALLVLSLLAASALSVATLKLQIDSTHDAYFSFLVWNLFLAWVPLAAAVGASMCARRAADPLALLLVGVWLLFFPNAPYVLTDFIHLHGNGPSPLWYDALMLSSFAWTALMLGFASLYVVHGIIRSRFGPAWGWLLVLTGLGLASFGVYLGRFARFNSWDLIVRPHRVLHTIGSEIENPLQHPRMIAALLLLTAFLLVGYLVIYALAELRLDLPRRRARGRDREPAPTETQVKRSVTNEPAHEPIPEHQTLLGRP